MGGEFGQTSEWDQDVSLSWDLLEYAPHQGLSQLIKKLNQLYKEESSLFAFNFSTKGYEWIDYSDHENSVLSFIRKSDDEHLIFILNYSPVIRHSYRIGVPDKQAYLEIINSDDPEFWGSGVLNQQILEAEKYPWQNRTYSLVLTLPPLGGVILKPYNK